MPRWLAGVLLLLAAYFPAAWLVSRAYVDPAPKGAVQVMGPFVWADGFAWWVTSPRPAGDFIFLEDDRNLVPEESFQSLTAVPGRFMHDGPRLLFSTRGNPNYGHHYWALQANVAVDRAGQR